MLPLFLVCAPWARANGSKSQTRLGNAERTLANIIPFIEGEIYLKVNRAKDTVCLTII